LAAALWAAPGAAPAAHGDVGRRKRTQRLGVDAPDRVMRNSRSTSLLASSYTVLPDDFLVPECGTARKKDQALGAKK
jgi:hypothetical protein